jgi:hypothetical protein
VREQLEWLQISNAYGENLRSKLADLPAYFPLERLESAIVKARMAKYQYETEQDALKDPASCATACSVETASPWTGPSAPCWTTCSRPGANC